MFEASTKCPVFRSIDSSVKCVFIAYVAHENERECRVKLDCHLCALTLMLYVYDISLYM